MKIRENTHYIKIHYGNKPYYLPLYQSNRITIVFDDEEIDIEREEFEILQNVYKLDENTTKEEFGKYLLAVRL